MESSEARYSTAPFANFLGRPSAHPESSTPSDRYLCRLVSHRRRTYRTGTHDVRRMRRSLEFNGPRPDERPQGRLRGSVHALGKPFPWSRRPSPWNDRPPILQERQCLLHSEEGALTFVSINFAKCSSVMLPGGSVQNAGRWQKRCQFVPSRLDGVIETVEVAQFGHVPERRKT